ncbi:capsular biosynthesis protein [Bacillus coahuilensis m2-6]|uniref:YveK family protein n=1 Tax=Bacillus coahuilensis TaxID=408580 RepID=UPI0007501BE8|nr:YveK family protein [Bacillus coahuilensis]KUP05102.1 capsular biosynthesis protein [Bacillus coahuilensis m2-6]
MEETISLRELLQTLRKRLLLIALITFSAVLISGVVSFFLLTPIYQSSTQILVNQTKSNQQQQFTSQDIQTNLQLINTYNVIMKSPAILDKVIEELDLNMTTSALNSSLTVGSEQNSQVVNLNVQHTDPEMAALIANKVAEVFQEEIPDLMNVDNVSILAEAQLGENPSPVKPQPVLNMAIGFVVGLMAAIGLAFLLEFLDNTLKSEQDIEKLLDLPVLGGVMIISEDDMAKIEENERNRRYRGDKVGA